MKPVVFLLFTAAFASARIGETPEECVSRYGKIVEKEKDIKGHERLFFKKGGITVTVTFYDGKACIIRFSKGNNEVFSESELQTLLAANGTNWTADGTSKWKCPKPPRSASSTPSRADLSIVDSVVIEKERKEEEAKKAVEDAKNLEGF